ncbi:hypothetical protein SALBM135S_08626 [Streptomyces alboniger]
MEGRDEPAVRHRIGQVDDRPGPHDGDPVGQLPAAAQYVSGEPEGAVDAFLDPRVGHSGQGAPDALLQQLAHRGVRDRPQGVGRGLVARGEEVPEGGWRHRPGQFAQSGTAPGAGAAAGEPLDLPEQRVVGGGVATDGGRAGQDGVLTAERQGKDSPRATAPVVAAIGGGAAVDGFQHELAGRRTRVRRAVVDPAAGECAVLAERGRRGAGRQCGEDPVVGEGLRAGRGGGGVVEGGQGAVGAGNTGGRVDAVPAAVVLAEHRGAPEGVAVVHLVVAVADARTATGPQDALAVEPAATVRGFELVAETALDAAAVGAQPVRLLRCEPLTGVVGPVGGAGEVLLVLLVPGDEELTADPVHGVAEGAVGQLQGVVPA